jgi:hypothetical protein
MQQWGKALGIDAFKSFTIMNVSLALAVETVCVKLSIQN